MRWVARGLAAGAAAGLVAGLLGLLLAEPSMDRAIALEEMRAVAEGRDDGGTVPRAWQEAGLVLGSVLWGVALGALLALAYAVARPRIRARDGTAALLVAGALFLALVAVPFVKYAPSPPGAGDPDTLGRRILLWIAMAAISLLAVLAATRLSARAAPRLRALEPWARPIAWAGIFGAIVIAAAAVMPAVDEVPPDVPAQLLWEFRGAALAVQAILWGILAVTFGLLVERSGDGGPRRG